ncbi:MAG: leucine-rich repeat domain-containing protein [Clostridia bacterium]|nr:leucine-rich repeat domain-containing protein [Clostridia bacterium]
MSVKNRILSIISIFALAIMLTLVGIWAVTDLDFTVGGDITYKVPTPVPAEELSHLTFYYNNNTMLASVSDCDTAVTAVEIPSLILYNNEIYEVNGTLDGGTYSGAFYGCTQLERVILPITTTQIGNGTFYGCTALTYITIPKNVVNIFGNAFNSCSSLTEIVIPDSVTNIGGNAFNKCISLQNITIGKGVATIESGTFANCTALEVINIPDNITTIKSGILAGSGAFSKCTNLTTVSIGSGLSSIASTVFHGCSSLKTVSIKALEAPEVTGSNLLFKDSSTLEAIYVPRSSVDAYKSATGWSDYADLIMPYDF